MALAMGGQETRNAEALKKGMPKDVASYIERVFECEHWSGEEPYDGGRQRQINRAVTKLRCDRLPQDRRKLRRKYRNDPKILKVLEEAHDLD